MKLKNILITFTLLSFNTVFAEPALVGETHEIKTVMEIVEDENPLDTQKINKLLIQKDTLL